MPEKVGIQTGFTAYGSYGTACKSLSVRTTVILCSNEVSDFVYKYEGNVGCYTGSCGMLVD